MQSLQRMEDKLKAVTKENIEMVGTEEQNEYYWRICVLVATSAWCIMYMNRQYALYIMCNTIAKIEPCVGLYYSWFTYHNIVYYAYMGNIFTWMYNHS